MEILSIVTRFGKWSYEPEQADQEPLSSRPHCCPTMVVLRPRWDLMSAVGTKGTCSRRLTTSASERVKRTCRLSGVTFRFWTRSRLQRNLDSWLCLDRGGYDSSHGGYHRTDRKSCRRGLRRGCVHTFFAPLMLPLPEAQFFGGIA
jgi:hypothetical protein